PMPRSALSTFRASGGMSIFTAALPKKPSVTANDLMLRSKPWLSACLMPDAASLELTDDEPLLDVVDVEEPLAVDNWFNVSHCVKSSMQDASESVFRRFMRQYFNVDKASIDSVRLPLPGNGRTGPSPCNCL